MATRLLKRRYIYDGAQRVLHWWLAFSVLALAATGLIASNMEPGGGRSYVWDLHMLAGTALLTGFAGRMVWGVIGPEHARLASLIHVKTWIESAKTRQMTTADSEFGHHKQACASYLGFYGLVALMCMTGFTLAGILHAVGPMADLLDELDNFRVVLRVHEYGWYAIAFFAVTHVMAMIFHEWRDQIPISQSMISGFQYRTAKKGERDESQ